MDGNTSIKDEPRSCRPPTASTDRNKERVDALIREDRRITRYARTQIDSDPQQEHYFEMTLLLLSVVNLAEEIYENLSNDRKIDCCENGAGVEPKFCSEGEEEKIVRHVLGGDRNP
ncbi:hypothetical protein C0J52_17306 [Blattella germanica]|nr:hypothetical protein C0J52_17306 [Blattella germanica]